jgi:hypothetical protein
LAAAALLSTSRHHVVPSMGPGRTEARSGAGMHDWTALRRSPDSRANCASRASEGASSAAWCTGTGWWRRIMKNEEGEEVQLIITDAWLARSRAIHLSGTRMVAASLAMSLALMVIAAALYHWVFLKGARERWPVIGSVVRFVVAE